MKSKTRGLLSFLLMLSMTFALLPTFQLTVLAAWDGSASIAWFTEDMKANTFLISDERELAGLAALVNAGASETVSYDSATGLVSPGATTVSGCDFSGKTIVLTADLDLNGQAWEPIGNSDDRPFQGSFNGSGYAVSGLNVNSTTYGGLFGCIGASGTVENLTVSGTITGTYSHTTGAGGIAALNYGTIKNCLNQCNITVDAYYVGIGGIVGENLGNIINCGNTGIINTISIGVGVKAGGISGGNYKLIFNCYNTGAISYNNNSYNSGYCGGLAGYTVCLDSDPSSVAIVNCYNKGTVEITNPGQYSFIGSLIGYLQSGMMSECYWLTDSHDNAAGRDNMSSTNICSFSSAGEFDSSLPEIDGKTCTDLTEALNTLVESSANSQSYCYWSGTEAAPLFITKWSQVAENAKPDTDYTVSENSYTIQTALGLAYVASLVNNGDPVDNITLSQDIDLSAYEWTPIGTASHPFSGTFDGSKHKITNMLINTTADNQGLFSFVQSGTVKNLMLTDHVVIGGSSCGGIASSISNGSLQNCGVTGAMIGNSSGGIVAEISDSNMESCYTMAIVKGTNCGLVSAQGKNSSSIQNTYYLSADAIPGIASCDGSVNDTTVGKDGASFSTGEVAWLLDTYGGGADYTHREIWSRDAHAPILTDSTHQTVYRALLENSANPTAVYSAANGQVTLPSTPSDVDGYTFLGWFADASFNNAYTSPLPLFRDESIYGNFGTRILKGGNYFTQYTRNPVNYSGAISDNASEMIGASPLSLTYYTDSLGTIPTTPANSGASGEGLAPIWVGMYYVKISAPEADSGGIKLKAANTLVGMRIKSKDTTNSYSVTATQGTGGTISVSNSTVEEGNSVTITITPKEGYEISDVLVNGVSVGAVSSYTIKAMASDITISAVYQAVDGEIDSEIENPIDSPEPNEPWSNPFQDVPEGSWYHSAVEYVCSNNLFHGTNATTFSPKSAMTRAMLVSVLGRLSGNTTGYSNAFLDVAEGSWYEQAAAWAAANGIVSGTGSDRFSPENNITHEQLAVMLYNYAKYKGYDVSILENANTLPFGDASYISDYANQALQWAYHSGLIRGDESGNLNPQGFATRAEGAAILERFVENIIS